MYTYFRYLSSPCLCDWHHSFLISHVPLSEGSQEVLQLLADETSTLQPGCHSRSVQHKHLNVFDTSGLHHFFPGQNIQCSLIPGAVPASFSLLPGTMCPSCYPGLSSAGTALQLHRSLDVRKWGRVVKRAWDRCWKSLGSRSCVLETCW